MRKNPLQTSHLLSASRSGECQATVLVRRHSRYYGDKQNWWLTPPERVKAGWGVCNGF